MRWRVGLLILLFISAAPVTYAALVLSSGSLYSPAEKRGAAIAIAFVWSGTALAYLVMRRIGTVIRQAEWREQGCCDRCGFDLRGTPAASDRCPECGAAR
jgi:hypothetical protein